MAKERYPETLWVQDIHMDGVPSRLDILDKHPTEILEEEDMVAEYRLCRTYLIREPPRTKVLAEVSHYTDDVC